MSFSVDDGSFLEPQGWLRLLAQTGPAARAWVEDFHARDSEQVSREISRAVGLIRQRRPDDAWQVLEGCRSNAVEALRDAPPSIRHALDSWWASAAAFYFFGLGDFDQAEAMVQLSADVVEQAIAEQEFLVVLGARFVDVELQRAQLARTLYRWQAMEQHITLAWRRLANEAPLCVLENGREITFSDIQQLLSAVRPENDDKAAEVEQLLDPRWRRLRFRALVAETYALPWMVLPYG